MKLRISYGNKEQKLEETYFISLTILCSRLKQDTKPSKRDREREREGTLEVWGERGSEREFKYSPSNFPRNQTLQFIKKT